MVQGEDMKSFNYFIKEQFSIARVNMPQIDDLEAFKGFVVSQGLDYSVNTDTVSHINPLQSVGEDEYKIRNICMSIRKDPDSIVDMKPIIVSDDGYVIDGHHRYYAAIREDVKIPYIVIHTTANKLLKIAYEFTTNNY